MGPRCFCNQQGGGFARPTMTSHTAQKPFDESAGASSQRPPLNSNSFPSWIRSAHSVGSGSAPKVRVLDYATPFAVVVTHPRCVWCPAKLNLIAHLSQRKGAPSLPPCTMGNAAMGRNRISEQRWKIT